MVLAIRSIEMKALKIDACTNGETCTVRGLATIAITHLHIVGTTQVVAASDIKLRGEDEVDTQTGMLQEGIIPMAEVAHGERKAERNVFAQTLGDAHQNVSRQALIFLVVSRELTT